MDRILTEMTYQIKHEQAIIWETKMKLCLRPKPDWLPDFAWKWLLKQLIVQEIHK